MEEFRMCGLPDALVLGLEVRRSPSATWFLAGDLAAVGRNQLRAAIQVAFARWSAVAGCSASETTDQAGASIVISTATLDGPQNVLADCELPGPTIQHMRIDNSEHWTIFTGPGVPRGQLDLVRVLTHELGHFWGMGHIATGNLMAPIYSDSIDRPVAGDIAEMHARYGPPVAAPAPAPTPSPSPDLPAEMWVVGQSGNVTAKYKLTRIPG